MKHCYIDKNFSAGSRIIIDQANDIIEEYEADGFSLTLRQLYYQFVSRDLLANKQAEYKRLGTIISDARLAGLISWSAIEDRTRNLKTNYHNTDPGDAVNDALYHFKLNKWLKQPFRPEVWIEKEALIGVIEKTCRDLDVPFFACKGYNSQSEMWRAGQRFASYHNNGQQPVIIHLGDHDPSGIDMTRDISARQDTFVGSGNVIVERIALNQDQIDEYNPPPNFAKLTDSRAKDYVKKHGGSSWELDALEPRVISTLIKDMVAKYTDDNMMEETTAMENEQRKILKHVVKNWKLL